MNIIKLLELQLPQYPEESELIASFRQSLNKLTSLKEKKISAKGRPPMPKVLWKLKSYVQTSLHRNIDLAIESALAWERKLPAVSFLLTRSIMECVAYLFDLSNHLLPKINENNLREISELIDKWKYGDRKIDGIPTITNTLTIMEHVEKIIPNYKINYEYLSNFCHPNYSGIGMLYSHQDMEEYCFEIGREYGENNKTFGIYIKAVVASLTLLEACMGRYEKIYPELIRIDSEFDQS
jgi:hypothetical protein